MESEGNIKNITIEEHLELVEKYFPTVNLKDPEHFFTFSYLIILK